MHPFYIIPNIKHYTREYVEYKRKPYRQERGVDKKQAYFTDRNIKTLAQVGAYSK